MWGAGDARIAHEGNGTIEPVSYSGGGGWERGVPLMEEWSWTGGELDGWCPGVRWLD